MLVLTWDPLTCVWVGSVRTRYGLVQSQGPDQHTAFWATIEAMALTAKHARAGRPVPS